MKRSGLMRLSTGVLEFVLAMLGVAWMWYGAWVVLIWLATNFAWGRVVARWYEATLLSASLVDAPIAFLVMVVTMGNWLVIPILVLKLGIDRLQKRLTRAYE